MRIGMLTGGGDCPGLNAVIRAVVRKGILHYNDEFIGFMEGWRGVLDDRTMPLDLQTTSGILHRGGTILRSSRTNVKKIEGGFETCLKVIQGTSSTPSSPSAATTPSPSPSNSPNAA